VAQALLHGRALLPYLATCESGFHTQALLHCERSVAVAAVASYSQCYMAALVTYDSSHVTCYM